ncbi:DUF6407 family protein [Jeotgalibacillus salarius]|uniref:Uncharacterized protein n=1 Tax=Jeotgalibacillus salarius TaxID=546023 RepID=A0A4Y8LGB1_9BACL|nr:DUF6407 family protein [Jeotgalibacillus salarius]TFE00617.1 hypothetical protein E2626_11620 [Jeotgalibacillus salarius]
MNFEHFAKERWQGNLVTFIKEALDFFQMKSRIEQDGEPHLYLDSIAEENMLTRLVEATGKYADIEAAFGGRVIRNY